MRSTSVGRSIDHGNGVFAMVGGRMAQVAHDPEPPRLSQMLGGYGYPVTPHFPRTSLETLPASVTGDLDLDGDGQADARATASVVVIDANGNGRADAGDLVVIEPRECRIIGVGVRLVLSEALLKSFCERISKAL